MGLSREENVETNLSNNQRSVLSRLFSPQIAHKKELWDDSEEKKVTYQRTRERRWLANESSVICRDFNQFHAYLLLQRLYYCCFLFFCAVPRTYFTSCFNFHNKLHFLLCWKASFFSFSHAVICSVKSSILYCSIMACHLQEHIIGWE